MSKVAVQLLSWNGAEELPAVLSSLAKQTFTDYELYILDSDSKDDSVAVIEEAIKSFPCPVHLNKAEKNLGFAGGHDLLFAASNEPYVFCVNQDVELHPMYLEKIVTFLDAHPDVGAAAGKLLRKGALVSAVDSAGLRPHRTGAVTDIGAGEDDHGQFNGLFEVFGVSGALPVYRRSAALAASVDGALFDADFFAYKEDVDLAWRMRLSGSKAFVVGDALAYHARSMHQGRRRDLWRQRLSIKNHLLVLVKNWPRSLWYYLPVVVGYEALKAVYLLFRAPAALGAYREFLGQLPNAIKMRKVIQSRAISRINRRFFSNVRR